MKNSSSVRPDWAFLFAHPAHFIALGFGSGLAPKAPGTFGSLAAIPLYALLYQVLTPLQIALFCIPAFILGTWAAHLAGKNLGVHDHGAVVIDEIVAMWLVLAIVPATVLGWISAFVLFRIFDILKPWPIGWLDAKVDGGFGVMVDDLLAAVYAIIAWLVLGVYLRNYLGW